MSKKATALATLGVFAFSASAFGAYSDPVIDVTITTGSGSGTFSVALGDGTINPDGSFFYSLGTPVSVMDGGNLLATLNGLTTFIHDDNSLMSSSFVLLADDEDIRVQISHNVMSFGAYNADARASAGLTVTDVDGDGGAASGNIGADNSVFEAWYNGATSFAQLVDGTVSPANPFGSHTESEDTPPGAGNFSPIGSAGSMSANWDFNLTADDSAGGTSVYVLVPSPGASVLLAVGGLSLAGRRRR